MLWKLSPVLLRPAKAADPMNTLCCWCSLLQEGQSGRVWSCAASLQGHSQALHALSLPAEACAEALFILSSQLFWAEMLHLIFNQIIKNHDHFSLPSHLTLNKILKLLRYLFIFNLERLLSSWNSVLWISASPPIAFNGKGILSEGRFSINWECYLQPKIWVLQNSMGSDSCCSYLPSINCN